MDKVECPVCHDKVETVNGRVGLHGNDCAGAVTLLDRLDDADSEARYTEASEWCPYPERWHSYDWDSAETEISDLVAAFVVALRPDVVVETGTAFAQTAGAIGLALRDAGVGHLYTVEIDPERCAKARHVLEPWPVEVVCQDSMSWMPPPGVGFAWFDSLPHLRVPEFRRYYNHFAPGAIVGFHDTAPHFGLWPEIEKLEEEGLLLPMRLRTPRGCVFGEVVVQERDT